MKKKKKLNFFHLSCKFLNCNNDRTGFTLGKLICFTKNKQKNKHKTTTKQPETTVHACIQKTNIKEVSFAGEAVESI